MQRRTTRGIRLATVPLGWPQCVVPPASVRLVSWCVCVRVCVCARARSCSRRSSSSRQVRSGQVRSKVRSRRERRLLGDFSNTGARNRPVLLWADGTCIKMSEAKTRLGLPLATTSRCTPPPSRSTRAPSRRHCRSSSNHSLSDAVSGAALTRGPSSTRRSMAIFTTRSSSHRLAAHPHASQVPAHGALGAGQGSRPLHGPSRGRCGAQVWGPARRQGSPLR